jgi:hypothetical protein
VTHYGDGRINDVKIQSDYSDREGLVGQKIIFV